MSINFIPNDPRAGVTAPVIRVQAKRANRPASRSGFVFNNPSPEALAAPGSPQFLFWQCREAAIAAIEAWESSGGRHTQWQGNRKKLPLFQDAGVELNAFYDRDSFSFFHQTIGTDTFFSGASTDVVAHEVGHGLIDSLREDFFDVNFLEVGAFHEAGGDCVAILTALADKDTRVKLLAQTATLRKRNFVESTAEDLSFGIKKFIPNHNAAEPRHAFNTFQYQLPQTLPPNGGPGVLINEEHSFGMVFTGCFWDLIANIFNASAAKDEVALSKAAVTAGQILIAGVKAVVVTPRFLQSMGRAMVLADQSLNAAASRDHIRNAFQTHNILLGTNAMVSPSMALSGEAPRGAVLSKSTEKDLLLRLGATKGAKLLKSAVNIFGTAMVNVVNTRDVSLSSLDKALKGVISRVHQNVMVGQSGARAAVMGTLPQNDDSDLEVLEFVKSLLEHNRIDFGKKRGAVAAANADTPITTHVIKTQGTKNTLVRKCYQCGGIH